MLITQLFNGPHVTGTPFNRRRRHRRVDLRETCLGECHADLPPRRSGCRNTWTWITNEPYFAGFDRSCAGTNIVWRQGSAWGGKHDVVKLKIRGPAVAELGHRKLTLQRYVLRS